jgi:hypothetical protein
MKSAITRRNFLALLGLGVSEFGLGFPISQFSVEKFFYQKESSLCLPIQLSGNLAILNKNTLSLSGFCTGLNFLHSCLRTLDPQKIILFEKYHNEISLFHIGKGKILKRLKAPIGFIFYGHGVADFNRGLLYTTMVRANGGVRHGFLSIRSLETLDELAIIPTGGARAHSVDFLTSDLLVVGNSGDQELNLHASLSTVHLETLSVKKVIDFPLAMGSTDHICTVGSDKVLVATQKSRLVKNWKKACEAFANSSSVDPDRSACKVRNSEWITSPILLVDIHSGKRIEISAAPELMLGNFDTGPLGGDRFFCSSRNSDTIHLIEKGAIKKTVSIPGFKPSSAALLENNGLLVVSGSGGLHFVDWESGKVLWERFLNMPGTCLHIEREHSLG